MIKEGHYQVSKAQDFSFRIYSMHKLASTDKFQAIKYMNPCPDLSSRFGWKQGQVHSVMKRQKLPILWASESRDVPPTEMQSDYGWVFGMESYFCIGKGTMEVLCTKTHTSDLGGSARSAFTLGPDCSCKFCFPSPNCWNEAEQVHSQSMGMVCQGGWQAVGLEIRMLLQFFAKSCIMLNNFSQ